MLRCHVSYSKTIKYNHIIYKRKKKSSTRNGHVLLQGILLNLTKWQKLQLSIQIFKLPYQHYFKSDGVIAIKYIYLVDNSVVSLSCTTTINYTKVNANTTAIPPFTYSKFFCVLIIFFLWICHVFLSCIDSIHLFQLNSVYDNKALDMSA